MKHTIFALMAAAALAAATLTGCYESVGFTWYEAGEYKGPEDPLLERLKTQELQGQLETRFRDVQIDR